VPSLALLEVRRGPSWLLLDEVECNASKDFRSRK
jgi:hypothetical protein